MTNWTRAFNFESFTVYQRAFSLSKTIYSITQKWPREYLFGITDQLRRASLSILLNIAEESSRTRKDFRHFLIIARGSCFECVSIIQLSLSLRLISQTEYDMLYTELKAISQMLSKFRSSLEAH